jgi:hypothetical protein
MINHNVAVNFNFPNLISADSVLKILVADVAELADALDSKSSIREDVWVRPPPSAPPFEKDFIAVLLSRQVPAF